jgi:hypothetical protein
MKRKNKLKIKKATQLLNKMAPKGEKLAYINNREAELLKRMGGAGKNINETGIKSYYYDEVGQTMGGTGFQDTSHLTGGSGTVDREQILHQHEPRPLLIHQTVEEAKV